MTKPTEDLPRTFEIDHAIMLLLDIFSRRFSVRANLCILYYGNKDSKEALRCTLCCVRSHVLDYKYSQYVRTAQRYFSTANLNETDLQPFADRGMTILYTSAKSGENVAKAFHELAAKMLGSGEESSEVSDVS